jgi:hypothetical protein
LIPHAVASWFSPGGFLFKKYPEKKAQNFINKGRLKDFDLSQERILRVFFNGAYTVHKSGICTVY